MEYGFYVGDNRHMKNLSTIFISALWLWAGLSWGQIVMPPLTDENEEVEGKPIPLTEGLAPRPQSPLSRFSMGLVEAWGDDFGFHAQNKQLRVTLRRKSLALDVFQSNAGLLWVGAGDTGTDFTLCIGREEKAVSLSDAKSVEVCSLRINRMAGFEVRLREFASLPSQSGIEVGLRLMLEQAEPEFIIEVILISGSGYAFVEFRYPRAFVKGSDPAEQVLVPARAAWWFGGVRNKGAYLAMLEPRQGASVGTARSAGILNAAWPMWRLERNIRPSLLCVRYIFFQEGNAATLARHAEERCKSDHLK